MQENRSFDHYFGTLRGVRGFGDRFPIPVPDAPASASRSGSSQRDAGTPPRASALPPRHAQSTSSCMRVERHAAHAGPTAGAWDDGRMERVAALQATITRWATSRRPTCPSSSRWPMPSRSATPTTARFTSGTNPNRLFLWTGTNDPLQQGVAPRSTTSTTTRVRSATAATPGSTYPERLEEAGSAGRSTRTWPTTSRDNPLAGFQQLPRRLVRRRARRDSRRSQRRAASCDARPRPARSEDVARTASCRRCRWIVATGRRLRASRPVEPGAGRRLHRSECWTR